ncbi:MAG: hypothetical protein M0Z66_12230 [Thermaerobacter sp.]|nr:hypothetical protein [Thermaerobacter sp.]
MQRKIFVVAVLSAMFAMAAPAVASANHLNGVSWSNPGSAQGIAHRSATGQTEKTTHDGVNYGRPRI